MTILRRIKQRTLGRFRKQPKPTPFAWRTVEQGALKGASVYVPANRSWGNDVVQDRYEAEFLTVLKASVADRGCLYDIGGHVGIFSLAWLMMGGDFVETFEPLPSNASLIQQVMERNQMQGRFQVHQLAVGDVAAEGTLVEHKLDSSRGQIAELDNITLSGRPLSARQRSHEIQIARLDDLLAQSKIKPPAIMKIDVEGAEHNVLQGASNVIQQFRPMILTEVHDARSGLETCSFLLKLDYSMRLLGGKGAKQSLPLVQWLPS